MKVIKIYNSYQYWSKSRQRALIDYRAMQDSQAPSAPVFLNRSYKSMHIEWWLHNVGYYLTWPLSFIPYFKSINERCRDVDLEEWPVEKSYFKR